MERECSRNIEVMWLIGGLAPDFKTIADFRKNNPKAIRLAFSKFSLLCDSLGLIGKELVAIDGSKFRANNSSDKYCTAKKTIKKIEHYEEQAKKYLALLDANDEQERQNPPPSITKKDLQKKLSGIEKRIGELQVQLGEIGEHGDIALTDPDSKMMQVKNSGREVSHNVQIAVDSKHHMVVAVDVTSEAVDKEQLFEEERYINGSACRQCLVREQCTKTSYHSIVEQPFQRYADVVDARTAQNKELVRQRKCLVEHPFGTLKRALGFTYFLTRRTENVRAESCMHFLIYNLKRAIQILATQQIVEGMGV
ncbi:transposase [Oscillospiraceae bacterium PP1C4]